MTTIGSRLINRLKSSIAIEGDYWIISRESPVSVILKDRGVPVACIGDISTKENNPVGMIIIGSSEAIGYEEGKAMKSLSLLGRPVLYWDHPLIFMTDEFSIPLQQTS